jgi:hypothetical protein
VNAGVTRYYINGTVFASPTDLNRTILFYGNASSCNDSLASVVYHPWADYNGQDSEELTIHVTEHSSSNVSSGNMRQDLTSEATDMVSIKVTKVNDAPGLTVPASFTLTTATTIKLRQPDGANLGELTTVDSLHLAGLSVFDVDLDEDFDGMLKVDVSVAQGNVSTTECRGVHFELAGGSCAVGTGDDRLLSTHQQLHFHANNEHAHGVLSSLYYHTTNMACGPLDTLTITVSDQGSTGPGPANVVTKTANIARVC